MLDPDAAVDFAAEHGLDDASVAALSGDPALQQAIHAAVDAANARLSRVERIKRFAVLADEWRRRRRAADADAEAQAPPIGLRYAAEIDALYSRVRALLARPRTR